MANIQILGKLGKNAEIKTVNQSTVAEFSLAETVGFGDRKQTIWYDCSLWGKQAQSNFVDYLNKGREVFVCGELTTHTTQDGKTYLKVRISDIKLTYGTKENAPQQSQNNQQGYAQQQQQQQPQNPQQNNGGYGSQNSAPLDNDLPFMRLDSRLA